MAFPTSPTDGQQATVNGKLYVYNSTDDKWSVFNIANASVVTSLLVSDNITSNTFYATSVLASTIGNTGATITGTHNGPLNGPFNGTVGATTPNTGAFTTVTTSANLTVNANASIAGNLVVGNISGRITPRVSSTASITSPLAWNSDSFDQYVATAQAGNLTINADAGTPVDGQKILFRFKDSGTARTLSFTTGATNAFRAVGVTLPTTTTISKITYVGCIYNSADSRWDAIAVTTEA